VKKILFFSAVLLLIGAGCQPSPSTPVSSPAPVHQPAPAPDPNGPAAHADLIVADSPKPGDLVKSPLTITGKARGTWFFEAAFPVKLIDSHGKVLASGPASAQADWMTTDFVPFKITLDFPLPSTATGTLELHNDNPSGLPEREDQLNIPVVFKAGTVTDNGCKPGGCFGEKCIDQGVTDDKKNCSKYIPAFTCYMGAACEHQTDGKCGWTAAPSLTSCLQAAAN
jgi:hypothetical protein